MCQRGVTFMILHSSRVSGSWRIFTSGRQTWFMGQRARETCVSSEDFPEDVKVDRLDGLGPMHAYASVTMWQQDVNVQSRYVQAQCKLKVLAYLGKLFMLQYQDWMRLIWESSVLHVRYTFARQVLMILVCFHLCITCCSQGALSW